MGNGLGSSLCPVSSDHWWRALNFDKDHSANEADRHRQEVIAYYSKLVVSLQEEKVQWFKGVLGPLQKMMGNIHGPLIERIVAE